MVSKDLTPVDSAALTQSFKTANSLVGKIFGPALEEFGLMIGDNMKIRRLNNQIKNFKKIEKIVSDNGITTKEVDLKVLVPYLNNVSLEEDETLQDMWVNLMVNYIDASVNLKITVYPSILSQLSSDEVRMLNTMNRGFGSISSLFPEWPHIINDQPLLNLIRLGLVEGPENHEWQRNSRFHETAAELGKRYNSEYQKQCEKLNH